MHSKIDISKYKNTRIKCPHKSNFEIFFFQFKMGVERDLLAEELISHS